MTIIEINEKYQIVYDENNNNLPLCALRYGDYWLDFKEDPMNNLELAMFYRILNDTH